MISSRRVIDLRLDLRESAGPTTRSIKSFMILGTARPTEILTGLSDNDPPLRVTAELIRPHP